MLVIFIMWSVFCISLITACIESFFISSTSMSKVSSMSSIHFGTGLPLSLFLETMPSITVLSKLLWYLKISAPNKTPCVTAYSSCAPINIPCVIVLLSLNLCKLNHLTFGFFFGPYERNTLVILRSSPCIFEHLLMSSEKEQFNMAKGYI